MWAYISVDRNGYSSFMTRQDNGRNLYLETDSDGVTLGVWTLDAHTNGSALVVDEWNHIALTSDGTNHLSYLNGILDATLVQDVSAVTPSKLWIGNNHSSEWLSGRIAGVKIYSAVLDANEVALERWSISPRRRANLNTWLPMNAAVLASNYIDYSGNGYNVTATGSPTVEDGPPVGWGANPLIVGGVGGTEPGPDYGTPRDHSGVKPWSSIWRPARA